MNANRNIHALCIAALLMLAAGAARANPANCDGELTDSQKTVRQYCETHIGCAMVVAIQNSCVAVKAFLNTLSRGGRPPSGKLDDQRYDTFMGEVEANPPEHWARMRRTIYDQVRELLKEQSGSRDGLNVYYSRATINLEICAQARTRTTREEDCRHAQKVVDECNAHRADWARKRDAVLAGGGDPRIGAITRERLGQVEMAPCPYTLPQTFLTPAQALEQWMKEDGFGAPAVLSRKGQGGAKLMEGGIRQAKQDELDRPARLAKLKAEQEAAAAEEERLKREQERLLAEQAEAERQAKAQSRAEIGQALLMLGKEIERYQKLKAERRAQEREETGRPGRPGECLNVDSAGNRIAPVCTINDGPVQISPNR